MVIQAEVIGGRLSGGCSVKIPGAPAMRVVIVRRYDGTDFPPEHLRVFRVFSCQRQPTPEERDLAKRLALPYLELNSSDTSGVNVSL